MQEPHETTSDWQECPAGALGGLVNRLQSRQRAQAARRRTVAAVALGLLFVGGYAGFSGLTTSPVYAGLACSDLKQHADAYLRHQLDPELTERISQHLAACPHCSERFNQKREMLNGNPSSHNEIDWSGPACRVTDRGSRNTSAGLLLAAAR
ncbi:MAG: zf-HC2 domain-containing protein [Planctomycetaceae bacterium]|nr:zf-HC2 domain-containing protein [Planctomycetaceae bacterium]